MKDDFGDLVHGVFVNPLRWNRRLIQGSSDIVSSAEVVNTFVSGKVFLLLLFFVWGKMVADGDGYSDWQESPV